MTRPFGYQGDVHDVHEGRRIPKVREHLSIQRCRRGLGRRQTHLFKLVGSSASLALRQGGDW